MGNETAKQKALAIVIEQMATVSDDDDKAAVLLATSEFYELGLRAAHPGRIPK